MEPSSSSRQNGGGGGDRNARETKNPGRKLDESPHVQNQSKETPVKATRGDPSSHQSGGGGGDRNARETKNPGRKLDESPHDPNQSKTPVEVTPGDPNNTTPRTTLHRKPQFDRTLSNEPVTIYRTVYPLIRRSLSNCVLESTSSAEAKSPVRAKSAGVDVERQRGQRATYLPETERILNALHGVSPTVTSVLPAVSATATAATPLNTKTPSALIRHPHSVPRGISGAGSTPKSAHASVAQPQYSRHGPSATSTLPTATATTATLKAKPPTMVSRHSLPSTIGSSSAPRSAHNTTGVQDQFTGTLLLNTNKAGMEGLPLEHINKVIQDASIGTPFHLQKERAQVELNKKIEEMKAQWKSFYKKTITAAELKADGIIAELESKNRFDEVIVHLDMDAYYAAVEIRENPQLKGKAIAVGGDSMLCTASYEARAKGVRSGMPGFIAKKLCPDLIIVRPRMARYVAISEEIQKIVQEFDYTANMMMDEVRLNVTNYMRARGIKDPEKIGTMMRESIRRNTGLTASVGIASNGLLAKICSNVNKPNGQHFLEGTPEKIKEFLRMLPVGKVRGIGRVTEQILKAFEITTCGELFERRALIYLLFKPATSRFLIASSVGIGDSNFDENELEGDQKSIGLERTFIGTDDMVEIGKKCDGICAELSAILKARNVEGLTFHLKIKTTSYDVRTKTEQLRMYVSDAAQLQPVGKSLLRSFAREIQPFAVRLMGVRLTGLRTVIPEVEGSQSRKTKQPLIRDIAADLASNPDRVTDCPVCGKKIEPPHSLRQHVNYCLDRAMGAVCDDEEKVKGKQAFCPQSHVFTPPRPPSLLPMKRKLSESAAQSSSSAKKFCGESSSKSIDTYFKKL